MDGKSVTENITGNAAIFWECSDRMDKLIEATEPTKK